MKNYICHILIFAIVVLNCSCIADNNNCPARQSEALKTNIVLVWAFDDNKILICTLRDKDNYSVEVIEAEKNIDVYFSGIYLEQNNNTLYLSANDTLYEYTMQGNLKTKSRLQELSTDMSQFSFGRYIKGSDNKIFLSLEPIENNIERVIEWNRKQPFFESKVVLYDLEKEEDSFGRKILNFKEEGGLFYIDTNNQKSVSDLVGFNEFTKVISSQYTSEENCIYYIDKDVKQRKKITWGQEAKWGSDGNIYFTRGSSELWRHNSRTMKEEKIYTNKMKSLKNEKIGGSNIEFTTNRSILAYNYINHFSDKSVDTTLAYRSGMLILDIHNNEYIELPPEWFYELYIELDKKGVSLSKKTYSYLIQKKHFLHLGNYKIYALDNTGVN